MLVATNLKLMHCQIIVLQLIDFGNGIILQLEFNYCTYQFVHGIILQLMSIHGWYYFALARTDNNNYAS